MTSGEMERIKEVLLDMTKSIYKDIRLLSSEIEKLSNRIDSLEKVKK